MVGSAVFVPITLGISSREQFSVHPNFRVAVQETNPMVRMTNTAITHDTSFNSAISPMAAINMMVELIGGRDGEFTRSNLTRYLGLSDPTEESGAIDLLQYQRRAEGNPTVNLALRMMQEHLEDPLTIRQITDVLDVSTRQLERNFRDLLAESLLKVYRNLRLNRARDLLAQTRLPLYEVSMACSFLNVTLIKSGSLKNMGNSR